jgi:purine-binding chemotaxis protein CheW
VHIFRSGPTNSSVNATTLDTPNGPSGAIDADGSRQLVVFRLDASEYALPVSVVGEVLRMVAITAVPEAPEWLPGVINLRGRVIPVIDLRTKLHLPAPKVGVNTPIIVAEHDGQTVGLVADAVSELLTVPADAIEPPNDMTATANAVEAVARAGDRLVLIFDLAQLCEGSERFATDR